MKYELFDYQREAVSGVLKRLDKAAREWADDRTRSSFALSAVTGAGKTVIATAVIEARIHGSAEFEVEPDPRATFLWVTDDPALNRQTRNKMLISSDLLSPNQLTVLGDDFLDAQLSPGKVYFLNIQQLAKRSGFAQGGRNLRQYSGWDVLGNTIRADNVDLYVVLDEAHRGMKTQRDRQSIVQRIIGGQGGSNPAAPIVWGISATIQRFTSAMEAHATDRLTYPAIEVDIEKVRVSGIVKDQIEIDEPVESGTFNHTLLGTAVDKTLDFESRWADYATSEHEPVVRPALVVQVADKPSNNYLREIIDVIEERWTGLDPKAVVNVFGEHQDIEVNGRTVRYVNPETIQNDPFARVVLAKEAISTGWDCPRAEVLFSDRAAKDATHIAQIIGRMVRAPLARRIPTDDALNSVSCFLPRFNREALGKVVGELTQPGEPGDAIDIVVNAKVFDRNDQIPGEVFDFVESLPSWPKPDQMASPLRRAMNLVTLLTDDATGTAMEPDAGANLRSDLFARLDGLRIEHAPAVEAQIEDLETLSARRLTVRTLDGQQVGNEERTQRTSARDLDRDTRRIVNSVKEGIGKGYVNHLVDKVGDDADILAARTEAAALFSVEGIREALDATATKWVRYRLELHTPDIAATTGKRWADFTKVREQSSDQEAVTIELGDSMKSATKTSNKPDAEDLPTFEGHLFADEAGRFPAKLGGWEQRVLKAEIDKRSFVSWYRNPSRAGTNAHRIGYQKDDGDWGSLQVDFLIISRRDDGSFGASIVDPHGDHLADSKAKLRGLAKFAEQFGDKFIRIDAINEVDGTLRVLNMLNPAVRQEVEAFVGGQVTSLYQSDLANDYHEA